MTSSANPELPFDAVYVINVRSHPERWDSARRQLREVGIEDPVRWDAVDGSVLDDETLRRLQREGRISTDLSGFDPRAHRGEIACARSHIAALENILDRGLSRALILEDDFALEGDSSDWRARLAAAYADLPEGWEVWFLFRCFDVRRRARRLSPRTVIPFSPLSATAYAVTAAGARKLLGAARRPGKAIDRIYAEDAVRKRRVRAFAASPPLVLPGEHPSIINIENPNKQWIEGGVNRPPEYWPDHYKEARGPFPWFRWIAAGVLMLAVVLTIVLARVR
ncbi:MAG: glycosyltransferase family 25 protein [Candidatus Eisenbacteria bacterium]|nr:glycosyltransferase family 25 protein [Candidatus Eisenbacteria bacterium]